jgi:hypothetical protein
MNMAKSWFLIFMFLDLRWEYKGLWVKLYESFLEINLHLIFINKILIY